MPSDQYTELRCGHGHGPLLEIPEHGPRCPACYPEMFIAEVKRLRRLVDSAPYAATEDDDG